MGTSFLYKRTNIKAMKVDATIQNSITTAADIPKVKKKITKKFGLSIDQVESKISKIEARIAELSGSENRGKRLKLFSEIKRLRQAKDQPDVYLFDKDAENQKRAEDRKRRIAKKLEKKRLNPGEAKKLKIQEIKKQKAKDRDRRKHCLFCKKYGHTLHECESRQMHEIKANICYNCGSSDHTLKDCGKIKAGKNSRLLYATCFICHESGH